MQTVPVKTSPAPNPLPSTWLRAIANSITAEFRRHDPPHKNRGWQEAKTLRALHATGRPAGHSLRTTATIPRTPYLTNTELIDSTLYLRGTIAPEDNPGHNFPPIAWLITQFQAAGALATRPDLHEPLNTLMRKGRWGLPYHSQPNRHGTPSLRPSHHVTTEERTAITLVAAAAQIVVIDELDYADWMHEDFNGELTLQLLQDAVH